MLFRSTWCEIERANSRRRKKNRRKARSIEPRLANYFPKKDRFSTIPNSQQKSREARGHVGGEQAADHRAETELRHLAAAFRRERADAANPNGDAQRICEALLVTKVAGKFVEHDAGVMNSEKSSLGRFLPSILISTEVGKIPSGESCR